MGFVDMLPYHLDLAFLLASVYFVVKKYQSYVRSRRLARFACVHGAEDPPTHTNKLPGGFERILILFTFKGR